MKAVPSPSAAPAGDPGGGGAQTQSAARTFDKPLGRFLFVFVLLLITLASALLSLRIKSNADHRTWEQCRRDLEARGEQLDWSEFIPPTVPDEQNFAMTPLLAPLLDCTNDVNGELKPRDPNAVTRLRELFAWAGSVRGGDWQRMTFADLSMWQRWLRGLTNEADELSFNPSNFPPAAVFSLGPMASPQFERGRRQVLRENIDVAAWLATPQSGSPADDILALMNRNAVELAELRAALKRPAARFNICYGPYDDRFDVQWPHLAALRKFALTFHDKATAELASGDATAALDDILSGFDVADTLEREPFFTSGQTRLATVRIMIQPVWEGLARGQWNNEQIATLQSRLERINLVEDMAHALRGERSANLFAIESVGRREQSRSAIEQPDGWICLEETAFARWFQQYILPPFDTTNRVVDLRLGEQLKSDFRRDHESPGRENGVAHTLIWNILFSPVIGRVANAQAAVNLATTACALERHRLVRGNYPVHLDELAPDFIKSVPSDPVNGHPLIYERTDPRHFLVYSVGLDGTDDEGSGERYHGHPLDWVWAYPEN